MVEALRQRQSSPFCPCCTRLYLQCFLFAALPGSVLVAFPASDHCIFVWYYHIN